ncbi:MAG: Ribosomal large subunit methyltransferase [Myxococcales bacterium]|nr:Ribosomal large subunit methyltransferase [Myxococcales bacterium]
MTPAELTELLAPHGLSAVESRRIFAHHVQHGRRHWDVKHMAKVKLARAAELLDTPTLEVVDRRRDPADNFMKYLFKLADGALVEAVRIPIFDDKYTLCLSSQAGCPLDCVFCATGRLGFTRNLETWEIVEQLRIVRDEADRPIRGVVFMGMGEPFLNYDNVIRAARIFADPSGGAISGRAITISTSGVVPAIRRFTDERHPYRLAISLTAATRARRRSLMPAAEKTWPIEELIDAAREHAAVTRQRVTLEYVAIAGVNCGADDAAALVELLRGIPVRINLIDVNDATGRFTPPSDAERRAFIDALQPLGAPIVRRYSGGKDVNAACGMLAATG